MLEGLKSVFRFSASKKITAGLWLLLCLFLVPRTLTKSEDISLGIFPSIIVGLIALNLIACTIHRIKSLTTPVLVMHIGTLLVLAGGVISSFGYVATVNIYEGSTVNAAYRWDLKKDMPLGVDLTLRKLKIQYYPTQLRIGVLQGEEKVGLFELRTGESFRVGQYTVMADSLIYPTEDVVLKVFVDGELVGSANTSGEENLPEGFPYKFRLVANIKPSLKMTGADIELSNDSNVICEGISEANSPLTCGGLSFYNTEVGADQAGLRYAGIQITKDPGRPYVYFGFLVTGIGSALYLARRLRGYRYL